jgi:dihydrofolate reductase
VRKLTIGTFVTIDGVMQAPGGPDEDRDGGFEHGGWSVNYWDDMMGRLIIEGVQRTDVLLLGRKTYEIFAAHWPHVPDQGDPVAAKLNSVKKYVASRTLKKAEWNNSFLISGDVAATIKELKEQPGGEIQVSGSGNLVQTLLQHDLVDELWLWVFPLVLGSGKRLFGDGAIPSAFRHIETRVSATGVAIHHYQRAGKIEYGSFEVDVAGSTSELWSGRDS